MQFSFDLHWEVMFYWAALYLTLGSSNHSIYFQLLNIFQWILGEETKGKESSAKKKKLHTLKIFSLQTLTILKFLIWNVLLKAFFLPQLRVGRLLPGHTDFEQGIHYGKSPLSLLLSLYITEKKCKQNPLHNSVPLFPVCISVCCGAPDLMSMASAQPLL